ncbi:hypothetical protein EJ03DRAFT_106251 [Teratosphaeria nubilosa]|uniref:Uncharacterized protein n=1 Tax=Teratosphaeria nubilosa TaxID=161662 RepID=A0A6G1L880_9PEZI|nr:hypothetical protein EJ03DRAFT_106251 [Teratosphaeria nubilosa]
MRQKHLSAVLIGAYTFISFRNQNGVRCLCRPLPKLPVPASMLGRPLCQERHYLGSARMSSALLRPVTHLQHPAPRFHCCQMRRRPSQRCLPDTTVRRTSTVMVAPRHVPSMHTPARLCARGHAGARRCAGQALYQAKLVAFAMQIRASGLACVLAFAS